MAVVAALQDLLDSEEFRTSPRSRDFLKYVVTESLAGRRHRLKARTVARYALGRTEAFDSATDAAARVQATRLRAVMGRYYAGTGASDRVLIELPLGTYVPTFSYRVAGPARRPRTALGPGLMVEQFATFAPVGADGPVALALTESLVHALGAFPGLRVIGPLASRRGVDAVVDTQVAARDLDAQYVLTGAVRSTATLLRVMIRLSDGVSGEVLWSDVFDQDRDGVTGFHDEDDIVRRIAATVGDFRGVVQRDAAQWRAGTRLPASHAAMLAYYRYLDSGTREDTEAAAHDLRAAVRFDPENILLLTMLGNIEYVLAIMGWAPDRDASLADAERLARTALALHAGHAHAWTVLAGVALARGYPEQCRQDASRAILVSPSHPSLLYASGFLLAISGDWETGVECIRESNRLNPDHPGYQHAPLALDRLMASDYAGMLAEASLVSNPEDLWGPLTRCLAFAGLGQDEQARQELDAALSIEPDLLNDDAALIIEQFRDIPVEVRTTIRERLLNWVGAAGQSRSTQRSMAQTTAITRPASSELT